MSRDDRKSRQGRNWAEDDDDEPGSELYLLAMPLVVNMFFTSGNDVLYSLGFYAMFALGGWLVQRAAALEAKVRSNPMGGRAPRVPYRAAAAVLAGLAAFGTARMLAGYDLWMSVLFGAGAAVGVLACYGLDRFGAAIRPSPAQVVRATLDQAKHSLKQLRGMRKTMENIEFRDRLDRLSASADKIVKLIREDHRELARAREFLNVYLEGTIKVTRTYLKTHGHAGEQAAALETRYSELLDGMEREFQAQHARLLRGDILDLDVELELLSHQLRQKGMM
jgi:hypothetical protein